VKSRLVASMLFCCLGLATTAANTAADGAPFIEINTVLMESTFKIASEGGGALGTAFIVGRPYADNPNRSAFVLVTAAHVLDGINGNTAVLHMREKVGTDQWKRLAWKIAIRTDATGSDGNTINRPLWTKHPRADVAVMYVSLPKQASFNQNPLVPMDLLATDKLLTDNEIHPGDEVTALGFPLGAESSSAGFPVLRSGKIASFPLLPTKETAVFLFDFRVFPGNSGGPVYFMQINRRVGNSINFGSYVQFIVGLVSEQVVVTERVISGTVNHSLGLARVVHASLIREAIELLPPPKP
jgi:S1-C subfamily serine protease